MLKIKVKYYCKLSVIENFIMNLYIGIWQEL